MSSHWKDFLLSLNSVKHTQTCPAPCPAGVLGLRQPCRALLVALALALAPLVGAVRGTPCHMPDINHLALSTILFVSPVACKTKTLS